MRRPWILLLVLALVVLAQAGCLRSHKPALARAAEYLWSQQAEDGGWHSHTYGLLRSGQSLTGFVLEALLEIPADVYPLPVDKVDRALAFIRRNMTSAGAVGMMDPSIPDYPNYSTALAVSALCRARRPGWERQVEPMLRYLRSQQFTEQNGWRREDPAYGAWGMGGVPRTPPNTGHVDLSMTRHVLEALRVARVPLSDPIFVRAQVFVERCQNIGADGGFFFSTTEFEINKAGHDGKQFRSYGTSTADGILALVAIGRPPEDAHMLAAKQWLVSHHHDIYVPGFVGIAYQRWPRGLAFYYAAASAEALRALQEKPGGQVAEGLERTQRPEGAWINAENLVKEDDPLIATPFAIRALTAYQRLQ